LLEEAGGTCGVVDGASLTESGMGFDRGWDGLLGGSGAALEGRGGVTVGGSVGDDWGGNVGDKDVTSLLKSISIGDSECPNSMGILGISK